MSFNLAGLTQYVDETSGELIYKTILGANTLAKGGVTVQPNIKSTMNINVLDSDLVAVASSCSFTGADTTTLKVVPLSVDDLSIPRQFCLQDLESYWAQVAIRPGSYNEELPLEGVFVQEQSDLVGGIIEKQVWQASKATGTGNLSLSDGFIQKIADEITAASGVVETAIGTYNATTAVDKVDDYVATLPSELVGAEGVKLYMSPKNFQYYLVAATKENLFHEAVDGDYDNGIRHRASNVVVFPAKGLSGIDTAMVLTPSKNLYVGTDLENDPENFKQWFSNDTQSLRFLIKYKIGTAIAFPEQVVYIS